MALLIPLSNGGFAKVDPEDFELVTGYIWRRTPFGYASRTSHKKPRNVFMHRLITPPPPGMDVDHINGDKLDNRRTNLRVCTRAQNSWNQKLRKDNTSGYKGVQWSKADNRWKAQITCHYRPHHLGYFLQLRDAVIAYNTAATKLFGEHACLNPIPPESDSVAQQTSSSSDSGHS